MAACPPGAAPERRASRCGGRIPRTGDAMASRPVLRSTVLALRATRCRGVARRAATGHRVSGNGRADARRNGPSGARGAALRSAQRGPAGLPGPSARPSHRAREEIVMPRIPGIDPTEAEGAIKTVFDAHTKRFGAPLSPYLLYARSPVLFRGA